MKKFILSIAIFFLFFVQSFSHVKHYKDYNYLEYELLEIISLSAIISMNLTEMEIIFQLIVKSVLKLQNWELIYINTLRKVKKII